MTEIFGPGWGNYALQGIVEIRLPDPVSWYPQTAGWWLLLTAALLGGLLKLWRSLRRWQRNRYRREGLAVLDALQARYRAGDQAVLRELAPLLRAVALHAGPDRRQLAALRGDAWARALAGLAPDEPPLAVAELDALAYAPAEQLDGSDKSHLFDSLRRWISRHDNPNA